MTNILLLSVGTRNKIVQYFKETLGTLGKIIATDCSNLAPALYDADDYYIVPRIDDENYVDEIITISKKESITIALSLIDPELSILAENIDRFKAAGVQLILSDQGTVDTCLDKYQFCRVLEKANIKTPRTYIDKSDIESALRIGDITYPLFVKPRYGSASLNINKAQNAEMLEVLLQEDDMIVQQFIAGDEYGVDAYFDIHTNELIDLFIKKKLKMRAGETDKAVSVNDQRIKDLVIETSRIFKFRGPVDFDIFVEDEKILVSEINPRFGGGYPHAYECGVNFPLLIINNEDNPNIPRMTNYEPDIFMMKYNEVIIKK